MKGQLGDYMGVYLQDNFRFSRRLSFYGWDMGLSKTFAVTERFKVQFRGEYFNIFNRVNFLGDEGTVNNFSTVSNGNFATLRTATDPRIGQIALKFIF